MMSAASGDQGAPGSEAEPTVLDFGPVVLAFTPTGKVICKVKEEMYHLTLNMGGRSGIIDAHLTTRGESAVHEPLGGLRSEDLTAILQQAQPKLERNLERLVRRTFRIAPRFGWLRHHGMYAFPMILQESALLKLGIRHGQRWKMDPERVAEQFARPLSRAEVDVSPDTAFLLFKRRHDAGPYGTLIKVQNRDGKIRYCWFRSDRMSNEIVRLWRRYEPFVRSRLLGGGEVEAAIQATHGRPG